LELADDIAYGVHDLEDAIGLRLIRRQNFKEWFEEEDRESKIRPLLEDNFQCKFDTFLENLFDKGSEARKHAIGHIVNFFVEKAVFVRSNPNFSEPLFQYQAVFEKKDDVGEILEILKQVVIDLVIKSTSVQQLEFKGQKMVTELFDAFATDPGRLLDERYFKKTIRGGGKDSTARVICDYISGMTDEYATKRYQQLFEPRVGSVFDRL